MKEHSNIIFTIINMVPLPSAFPAPNFDPVKWNFIATHLNQNFSLADIIDGETFLSQNFVLVEINKNEEHLFTK